MLILSKAIGIHRFCLMEDAGRHGQGGTSVPAAGLVLKQTPMAGEGARCAPRPER